MSSALASFVNAADLSVEMLKKALAANNLPQYGTKEQMLQRLIAPANPKKPAGKSVPKKKKPTSGASTTPAADMAAFMMTERPRLIAMGIVDTAAQDAELKRRWALVSKSNGKAKQTLSSEVRLETCLTPSELASMGLKLVNCDTSSGTPVFVYEKVGGAKAAPVTKAKPAAKRKRAAAAEEEEEEEDDDDDSDDEDMEFACEIMVERLMKHASKETLSALCGEFGVNTTGTKKSLAEALAEQCHYETDEDDDDDE